MLIICAINFFDLQIVKGSFVRYIQFGYLIIAIVMAIPYIFTKDKGFVLPVQLIVGSVFLSIFIAIFSRGQSFIDSAIGSIPVLVWSVFFYLRHIDYSVLKLEKIILGYGILYLILYFFQFTHPTNNYFVDLNILDDSRGILRIVFPGRGLFYLATFIAINKSTTTNTNKWFWIFLSLMGIVVTFMQVTRQFILGALLMYIIHFLKDVSFLKKAIIATVLAGLMIYVFQSDYSIVSGLKDTQEQTQNSGSDYVRIKAAAFFLTDFSALPFHHFFGNGVPYGSDSPYMKFYSFYVENYGYWLSDVGLVAVYAMFGVIAVLGYLLIWVKSFVYTVPKQFQYLKYYLWFLLITCLTSDTVYSPNDLIATVIVVYIYQVVIERTGVSQLNQPAQLAHA